MLDYKIEELKIEDLEEVLKSLFSLAFKELNLDIKEGTEYVKNKLERDYNKLSYRTKKLLQARYDNIIDVLFKK